MARAILFLIFIATLTSGCATVKVSDAEQSFEIAALAKNLTALSPQVNPVEALRAADTAVRYPLVLAEEWSATPPAAFNNTLINVGIHPCGLCYQWADALTVKLLTLHLQTLELHRGVAKLGTRREHSCVVLTAPGQNFTNGIALDAWRHCGKLNVSSVPADKYAWQEVDLLPFYQAELRAAAGKLEPSSNLR
ncbi:MAG: hypothetical protein RL616_953 [Verrucomicrobiota bacterium]|jgi:hypothetical protein